MTEVYVLQHFLKIVVIKILNIFLAATTVHHVFGIKCPFPMGLSQTVILCPIWLVVTVYSHYTTITSASTPHHHFIATPPIPRRFKPFHSWTEPTADEEAGGIQGVTHIVEVAGTGQMVGHHLAHRPITQDPLTVQFVGKFSAVSCITDAQYPSPLCTVLFVNIK